MVTSYGGGIVVFDDVPVSDLGAEDFVFYEPPADVSAIDGM